MDGFLKNKEIVRVVSLARETPTGSPFHRYQIWKQSTEE